MKRTKLTDGLLRALDRFAAGAYPSASGKSLAALEEHGLVVYIRSGGSHLTEKGKALADKRRQDKAKK